MVKNNYGIYDDCAKNFISTFLADNDDVAIRSFKRDVLKAPDSVPVDDFVLFKLGTYDDENGIYTNDKNLLIKGFECFVNKSDGGESCINISATPTDQK